MKKWNYTTVTHSAGRKAGRRTRTQRTGVVAEEQAADAGGEGEAEDVGVPPREGEALLEGGAVELVRAAFHGC